MVHDMDATSTRPRAGIYCRISYDPGQTRAGVDRQAADCRALAEREGAEVVGVYVDNDESAFRGRARPEWARLRAAVARGEVDLLVAWHSDRLWRDVAEQQVVLRELRDGGVRAVLTPTGRHDPGNADDRMHSTLLAAFAEHESARKSARLLRAHESAAKEGRLAGRGRRPYGYTPDRSALVETEVAVIREMAERVLAGESGVSLARELNARGVTTSSGSRWSSSRLASLLRGPHLAGIRTHRGEEVGPATWPAVLDEVTHRRLVARYDGQTASHRGPRLRRRLLTGLLLCGRCGEPMLGVAGERYSCRDQPPRRGCGRVAVQGAPLEGMVRDDALGVLADGGIVRALAGREDVDRAALVEQLHEAEEAMTQLALDHYSDRLISRAEFLAAREGLEARVDLVREGLRESDVPGHLLDLPSGAAALRAAWDAHEVAWRRSILDVVLVDVTIAPAVRGLNRFDARRVTYDWRV